jgi:hypothetical protein
MLTTQITLNDQQTVALRSLVQRTGKTETELIVEAVEQFITQHNQAESSAALQQAKGLWQNRADLPELRTLREESNRYAAFTEAPPLPLTAWRYDTEVMAEGRVELQLPLQPGSHVVVYVSEEPAVEAVDGLLAAASTSMDFWDNALDDEDWNNA